MTRLNAADIFLLAGGLIAALTFAVAWARSFRKTLNDSEWLYSRVMSLRGDPLHQHRRRFGRTLNWARHAIGGEASGYFSVWTAQAFLLCLGLAAVYPQVFILIAWLVAPTSEAQQRFFGLAPVANTLPMFSLPDRICSVLLVLVCYIPVFLVGIIPARKTHPSIASFFAGVICTLFTVVPTVLFFSLNEAFSLLTAVIPTALVVTRATTYGGQRSGWWTLAGILALEGCRYLPVAGFTIGQFPIPIIPAIGVVASKCADAALCICVMKLVTGEIRLASWWLAVYAAAWALYLFPSMTRLLPDSYSSMMGDGDLALFAEYAADLFVCGLVSLLIARIFKFARHRDSSGHGLVAVPALILLSWVPPFLTIIMPTGAPVILQTLVPAINAPLDWIAVCLTIYVLKSLYHFSDEVYLATEGPFRSIVQPAIILLNIMFGTLLSVLVVLGTEIEILAFDWLTQRKYGPGHFVVDGASLVLGIWIQPSNPTFWWLYATMLWTVMPALLPLLAYLLALSAIASRPLTPLLIRWVNRVRSQAAGHRMGYAFAASGLYSGIEIVPIAIGILFLGENLPRLFEWIGPTNWHGFIYNVFLFVGNIWGRSSQFLHLD
jgi:hypothetical protein